MSQTPSAACCNVPPVVAKGYEPKGKYITVDGLKTYNAGPSDAKKAILIIYDIFGFKEQTLQGADILAFGDKQQSYQVFMPDLFEGDPAPLEWFPPTDDEKKQKLGNFFSTTAAPPKNVERVKKVVEDIKRQFSNIKSIGVLGFCWGGKIVNLTSQQGTPFKAAAAAHPAMVDPADAPGITIPFAMLPSKDEDKTAVEKWQQGIKTENIVEWFPTQIHGFMAARSNLSDPEVKKEYERGYKIVLDFFHKHL